MKIALAAALVLGTASAALANERDEPACASQLCCLADALAVPTP
jgi:hypothetical protein